MSDLQTLVLCKSFPLNPLVDHTPWRKRNKRRRHLAIRVLSTSSRRQCHLKPQVSKGPSSLILKDGVNWVRVFGPSVNGRLKVPVVERRKCPQIVWTSSEVLVGRVPQSFHSKCIKTHSLHCAHLCTYHIIINLVLGASSKCFTGPLGNGHSKGKIFPGEHWTVFDQIWHLQVNSDFSEVFRRSTPSVLRINGKRQNCGNFQSWLLKTLIDLNDSLARLPAFLGSWDFDDLISKSFI